METQLSSWSLVEIGVKPPHDILEWFKKRLSLKICLNLIQNKHKKNTFKPTQQSYSEKKIDQFI